MEDQLVSMLQELTTAIKAIAPEVYEAAYRHAVLVGAIDIVIGVILLAICVLFAISTVRWVRVYREGGGTYKVSEYADYATIAFIMMAISGISSGGFMVSGLLRVLNPAYYAIKIILDLV